MIRYAAYGSNLHPLRLRGRVSSAALVGTVMLDGWSLKFHKRGRDGSGKCNVVASQDAVFLALYDIDHSGKRQLDTIEGLGLGYEEGRILIPGFGECFYYAASDAHIQDDLQPFAWYKELVLAGLEYHRAPAQYLRDILAVSAQEDSQESRHQENMGIVTAARHAS